mmetsp:Transcript_22150/g.51079  ORF Transcript_22150/g.51079 Transcript_22150/m.51079 type:complete len:409 (+) Transcript_22150:352-1578(+)|eukprot:CAMPEP_0116826612 /NCGR_PEP_ID=MMETSP0418-20121206/2626_1 /TAXON_ID=1158023 /ORGANISM="Astrosyne radiata, Strain 13vi08-1A" /LENGTH=408 /DNA_ID=CAMNT_0004455267 /DNA_START=334 /DNA_END=1560 /DNA_ORIENTATION=+
MPRPQRFIFNRKKGRTARAERPPRVVIDAVPASKAQSLGTGDWKNELVIFTPSPTKSQGDESMTSISSRDLLADFDSEVAKTAGNRRRLRDMLKTDGLLGPVNFRRITSSFLRVADLQMTTRAADDDEESYPHYHHASVDPPPGVEMDPHEQWVALDDGAGSHAPIAPFAVAALARFGLKTAMDESMWKAESKTERLLRTSQSWQDCAWQKGQIRDLPVEQEEVLVWTGNFMHGLYGSDLPAVRAAGIVHMSPKDLCDLLVDSTRVKEYNKLSLGRTDLKILQGDMQEDGPFGKSITKIVRSESKPPLVRKTMQLVSVMHATQLSDGGYLLVTRAVTQAPEEVAPSLRSEILMGVNVIRRITGHKDCCLMVNVNHMRSPMVPMMIAKKIGLSAAHSFISHDLRAMCKK